MNLNLHFHTLALFEEMAQAEEAWACREPSLADDYR
jgi:hypothetical protein